MPCKLCPGEKSQYCHDASEIVGNPIHGFSNNLAANTSTKGVHSSQTLCNARTGTRPRDNLNLETLSWGNFDFPSLSCPFAMMKNYLIIKL